MEVRPFGDADESFLVWGNKYRLENTDQVLVRLKVEHSGLGKLNNQRFGSNFFEEVANPSESELRWLTQSCIFYISGKMNAIIPQNPIIITPLSLL